MTATCVGEELEFELHPNLLRHVIERQAPSLPKAVLEIAMNAVDAGASRLDITLTSNQLIASDDGRGFGGDAGEIKRVFGVFGEPHEEEDVPMGEFRMGRGQIFAHGATVYDSGPFRLSVDLRGRGRSWRLDQVSGFQAGCRITVNLYERLGDPADSAEEVAELVRYLPIAVLINGRQVSEPPQDLAWDLETDEAWFRIGAGPLRIYNRGAFVRDYPAEHWGLGGVVVSKSRLAVTFGRNEIMRSCPVFHRITTSLDDAFREALCKRKSRSLPEAMRARAARLLVSGKIAFEDVAPFYLLRDARGAWMSLNALTRFSAVAVGPLGDARALRAISTGKAMVVAAECLEDLGVSLAQILAALRRAHITPPVLLAWEQVLAEIVLGREPVPEDKLDPHVRAVLFGAQVASRALAALIEGTATWEGAVPVRRVLAATRDSEDVFSDGETFVGLSLNILEGLSKGRFSFATAVAVLAEGYLRFPAPAGDAAFHPVENAMIDAMVSAAYRHLANSPVAELAIARSPLSGDPHIFSRWWNNRVPVRDLGDVARAWAEDYARRCVGLGVEPKASLLQAAGIRMADIRRTEQDGVALDPSVEPAAWLENFRLAAQGKLTALGLQHWTFRVEKRTLLAERDKPQRTRFDAASRRDREWRAKCVGGFGYGNPWGHELVRWAEETLPPAPEGLPPLPYRLGTKAKPKAIATVVDELAILLIKAELVIAGFRSGWPRDLGREVYERLIAYAPRRQTYPEKAFDGATHNRVPTGRMEVRIHPRQPEARILRMSDADQYVGLLLDADHGPFRRRAADWVTGIAHSLRIELQWYHIAYLGWPRIARMLRRLVLGQAGGMALIYKHRKDGSRLDRPAVPFDYGEEDPYAEEFEGE